MSKTAVALFRNPIRAEEVIGEIEKLGLPSRDVRALDEPNFFSVSGVMSFARLDFEVDVREGLREIGASNLEEEAYIEGLRSGGILVLASGSDDRIEVAAEIMKREGGVGLAEFIRNANDVQGR